MKNYYNIKPGTLVKLQGQFISTSFHDESEDDIQWNGDKVLPEDLLVYLGDDVVRNMRWLRSKSLPSGAKPRGMMIG